MDPQKSSFRGPRRSSDKVIKSMITENGLEESFHDFDRNEITLMELRILKSKCDLYQNFQLDDMANAKSIKKGVFKMKGSVNKLATSNRLKFKIASGTHGLRSKLSRRDNGSNSCVCCELDKEESVEHFLLECP
eukprot:Awhi_evm1s1375